MGTCPACGASAPATATWCGQCYAPLTSSGSSNPGAAAAGAGGDRFGIVQGPVATHVTPAPAYAQAPAHAATAPATVPDQRSARGHPAPGRHLAGWAPPAAPTPPVEQSRTGTIPDWGKGSTTHLVVGAIALGALMQLVLFLVSRRHTVEPEALVRYAIAATITFYAGLAVILVQRIMSGGVRLFWHNGRAGATVALGLGIGGVLGLIGVGVNSAASGELATDPGITLMVSEGDFPHIAAVVLISMVAAPFVEEVLFRGLFAESMRARGMGAAIWLSAIAFALWHLNPSALRYYALMGALLGLIYWKRGLLCSIATHAAFNGCLTVVAVMLALSPGHTVTSGDLTFEAPGGWHDAVEDVGLPGDGFIALEGPSGAGVLAMEYPVLPGERTRPQELVEQLRAGVIPVDGLDEVGALDAVTLPAGEAIDVSLVVQGHAGRMVVVSTPDSVVQLVLVSAGSVQAERDFESMLRTLRVG